MYTFTVICDLCDLCGDFVALYHGCVCILFFVITVISLDSLYFLLIVTQLRIYKFTHVQQQKDRSFLFT